MAWGQLTNIPQPPDGTTWDTGTITITPADASGYGWTDGVRPATWPIRGVLNASKTAYVVPGTSTAVRVPCADTGSSVDPPSVIIDQKLIATNGFDGGRTETGKITATSAGTVDLRGAYRAALTYVNNPGVAASGLTTSDIGNTVAAKVHTHVAADITDLATYLAGADLITKTMAPGEIWNVSAAEMVGHTPYRFTATNSSGMVDFWYVASVKYLIADTGMVLSAAAISVSAGSTAAQTTVDPGVGVFRIWLDPATGLPIIKNTHATASIGVRLRKLRN